MGNSEIVYTLDQKRAMKIMSSGKNIFLSGAAGTGKSFLINEYIKKNREKNIIVCAPTGVAAVNVGGVTLHKLFWIPKGILRVGEYNTSPRRAIEQADIIIIDEISMCRIDAFEYVIRTLFNIATRKRLAGDTDHYEKQVILVGDFYQLPPVLNSEDRDSFLTEWGLMRGEDLFAFNSTLWDELELVNIVLKTPIRQSEDLKYIDNLNKIRIGDASGIEWFNANLRRKPISDAVFICGKNDKAKEINDSCTERVAGDGKTYLAEVTGKVDFKDIPVSFELTLKIGMRVMTVINSSDESFQNGSLGYITRLEDDCVEIKLTNGKIVFVKAFNWQLYNYVVVDDRVEKELIGSFKQLPIKVAYAITIHKSQGQTYSAVNVAPECFDKGQLYVALSRVKRAENMCISGSIDEQSLRTSKAVCDFYDDIDDELLGYEFDEHKWDHEPMAVDEPVDSDKIHSYMYRIKKVKAQAYSSWSEQEDKQLQEEISAGIRINEIAKIHERTIGAIRSRARKQFEESM